jgi:hypothetical protein
MTTSDRALVFVAFSVLGLAGWTSPPADKAGDEGGKAVEKPAADASKSQLVLLTDGRIIEGVVTEEDGKVVVTSPVGIMRFPEGKVERTFDTIQGIHRYKLEQVPEEDMDEQLKLAQWCLSKHLNAEARGHLDAILKLDPKHARAKAMLTSIGMAEARMAQRQQRDDDVRQAGAEIVEPPPTSRPAALDMAVVQGARRGLGLSDLPVIFDLPPSAALKRAQEFQNYVHPVLQSYCAKCHNDRYEGNFQLIEFKRKADRTTDSLRTNLDAALALVDRENPGRSELLASSLRPHGKGPNTRPIFQGSNDRAYQVLQAWVNNLRARPTPAAAAPDPGAPGGPAEEFAAGRSRISSGTVDVEPVAGGEPVGGPPPKTTINIPPKRFTPGVGWTEDEAANPDEYPVPFAVSGVKPKLPGEGKPAIPAPRRLPIARPGVATPNGLPPLPAADQAAAGATEGGEDEVETPSPAAALSSAKQPAKPLKLDPALLQKALQLKNGKR